MTPPHQRSALLSGVAHGFFGRAGGVSAPPYDSLNGGPGSADDPSAVDQNRTRVTGALGASALVTAYQVHGADAAFVVDAAGSRPRADGLVTDQPGLAIGVLAADCVPVLFWAPGAGLIGAAHAGWRGSLAGILEATVALMVTHGAPVPTITAALGPALRAPAFEVGDDLREAVLEQTPDAATCFTPRTTEGKWTYDHIRYIRLRLGAAGLTPAQIDDVGGCTLTTPDLYFSYRHSRQVDAADYGRNISAIALAR